MNTSFLLGTSPMYPKARNMKIPAKMQIRLLICISLFWPMMVANSLIESAVITQNKIVNEIGPPMMHPTSIITKMNPVIARSIKLFFTVVYVLGFIFKQKYNCHPVWTR